MSAQDLCVGVTEVGINDVMSQLFQNAHLKTQFFQGSVTETLEGQDVTADYQVVDLPSVSLIPPTDAEWTAAHKVDPKASYPLKQLYQLSFPKASITIKMANTPPLAATGGIIFYCTFDVTDDTLSLAPVAVSLDQSKFSAIDKFIVNGLIIPTVLTKAKDMLGAVPIPTLPSVGGITFADPVAAIIDQSSIAAATVMQGNISPASLTGFSPPEGLNFFATMNLDLANVLIQSFVLGKQFAPVPDKSGTDDWYASAAVKMTVSAASASMNGGSVEIAIGLSDASATAELGGTGVGVTKAILCPIGAAADAIADPGNWDKVISTFGLTYSPSPVPVPVSFDIAQDESDPSKQNVQLSIGEIGEVTVIASPKWSGSITGTVLATAASAVIDLITAISKGAIVNKILKKDGQNIVIYGVPTVTETLEGVTVAVTVPNGTALSPFGQTSVAQAFELSIS